MNGKLIVIEGQDGVGKQTQTELLIKRLAESSDLHGKSIKSWSFPNYSSPWGKLVRQYLDGDSPFHLDPGYASLLYAADRSLVANDIRAALENGDWVVCDRYVSSNMIFQSISFPDLSKRDQFIDWLDWLEYTHFNIPRPDLTLLLSLPSSISFARANERREAFEKTTKDRSDKIGKQDIHEDNFDFMSLATAEYSRLGNKLQWPTIVCGDEQTKTQFSREVIHEKIWEVVQRLFL